MQRTTSYDFDVITGPSTPPRPPQPQPTPQAPPRGEAATQPASGGQDRG